MDVHIKTLSDTRDKMTTYLLQTNTLDQITIHKIFTTNYCYQVSQMNCHYCRMAYHIIVKRISFVCVHVCVCACVRECASVFVNVRDLLSVREFVRV